MHAIVLLMFCISNVVFYTYSAELLKILIDNFRPRAGVERSEGSKSQMLVLTPKYRYNWVISQISPLCTWCEDKFAVDSDRDLQPAVLLVPFDKGNLMATLGFSFALSPLAFIIYTLFHKVKHSYIDP